MIFEAANPLVFEWYIKNYGNEINLFINHSQILQLKGLRQNIWATSPLEAESPTRPSQPIGYTAAITRHGEAYHVNSI